MEYHSSYSYSLTDFKAALKSPQILPPDVNPESAEEVLAWYRPWRRRLYITAPVIFFSHLMPMLVFLTLCITFGAISLNRAKPTQAKYKFWSVLPETLTGLTTFIVFTYIEHAIVPMFWRRHARQLVEAGTFDPAIRKGGFGSGMTVLEVGCGDGKASATLARAILDRQRDIERMHQPTAALPTFIGYDSWPKFARLPNTPRAYLYSLIKAGVPRYHILANRVDPVHHVDAATQLHTLPYASDSITLVISSLGLTQLGGFKQPEEKRRALFLEFCRVLEPGGRMVLFEQRGISVDDGVRSNIFVGSAYSYKRMLVNVLKWPEENVTTSWQYGIHRLVAVKPTENL